MKEKRNSIFRRRGMRLLTVILMMVTGLLPLTAYGGEYRGEISRQASKSGNSSVWTMAASSEGKYSSTKTIPAGSEIDAQIYHIFYVREHANAEYVNTENMEMDRFVRLATTAKGMAGYTRTSDEDKIEGYIASLNYEIPVYDVDESSSYYIALPNINMAGGPDPYNITVAYNNDYAETLPGTKYEDHILYIPKSAVDRPANENEVVNDAEMLAIQMNYALGNTTDYSKTIPVEILSGNAPKKMQITVENIFDDAMVQVPTGVKGQSSDDISVMLNGMLIPVSGDAWSYDASSGVITVHSCGGVLSGINILFRKENLLEKTAKTIGLAGEAYAATAQDEMKYFKDSNENYVYVNAENIYVGWRGNYSGKSTHMTGSNGKHSASEINSYFFNDLKGWANSLKYAYAGYTKADSIRGSTAEADQLVASWAIMSYALATDLDTKTTKQSGAKLSADSKVEMNGSKQTIYEWMMKYRNTLEALGTSAKSPASGNNVGGFSNFGFTFPGGTVTGLDKNMISDPENEYYGKGNPDIKFSSRELDSSYWMAASCIHLGVAAEEGDADGDIYVTCIGRTKDYVVLAFVIDRKGQSGFSIYKFKTGTPVKLQKSSGNTAVSKDNRCYSLKGATFKLYENSTDAKNGSNAIAEWVADENGNTTAQTVPVGDSYLVETKAGKNYNIPEEYRAANGGKKITVTASSSVQTFSVTDLPKMDPTKIVLGKCNLETDAKAPAAGASLENAEFEVKYYDTENKSEIGEARLKYTWKFRTDSDGNAEFSDKYKISGSDLTRDANGKYALPVGIITIQETKAPEGYLRNDTVYIQTIAGGNGVSETLDVYDEAAASTRIGEQVIRSGLQFKKKDDSGESLANCAFLLKENATGETHVIVTDANGQFRSERYAHSSNTNVNDAAYDAKTGEVDSSKLNYKAGVWFSMDGKGNTAKPADSVGALPYSEGKNKYTLTELRCTANEGRELIRAITFEINEDAVRLNEAGTKILELDAADLGTLYDAFLPPEIGTSARESKHGLPIAVAEKDVTIVDTVQYTGLNRSKTYILKGTLMDQSTGKPLAVDGNEVTSELSFRPEAAKGSVEMKFHLDGSALAGTSVVVFEKLYLKYGTVEYPVAKHEDITDEAQTIRFPKAETQAVSEETGTHTGMPQKKAVILDEVKYSNVIPGKEYEVRGVLMDRDSGKEILDEDGKSITASGIFTAEKSSGSVILRYELDASLLAKKTAVVFEDMYYDGIRIASHADLTDEAQSVHYPDIGTVATVNGTHYAQVSDAQGKDTPKTTLIDTVQYENLVPGEKYTVSGALMDKDTGKALADSNGKGVTAHTTFTAEKENGSVTVKFQIDAGTLTGKTLVAFEQLLSNGKVLVTHEDINDAAQSVRVIRIHTSAAESGTGKKEISKSGSVKVVDEVRYEGLIPGKKYVLKGTLMSKKTGKAISGAETEKSFFPKESSGSVRVSFTLDTASFIGTKAVAFEELYTSEDSRMVMIASHKDLKDKDQTVRFRKKEGDNTVIATGDTKNLMLAAAAGLTALIALRILRRRRAR